jgi:SAM-dependent methyltransferase
VNKVRKQHWEKVYQDKEEQSTSWFQPRPETSLRLFDATGEPHDAPCIDVGGGNSRLVDHLLDAGWQHISVLDIAHSALTASRTRLGERASLVTWLEQDLLEDNLKPGFRIWHDRAVFHFLTEDKDRQRYIQQLQQALVPGGHCIIATFSSDGPEACSGLPVQRYSSELLAQTLGNRFKLIKTRQEDHSTPGGKTQSFTYCLFDFQP